MLTSPPFLVLSKNCIANHFTSLQFSAVIIFINSGYFYSAFSSPLLLRGAPDSKDSVSDFHAEAPQATVSEGLA